MKSASPALIALLASGQFRAVELVTLTLVGGTSYPAAKAERLPAVACRYTEVELQLALLDRDLAWIERCADDRARAAALAEWRAKLAELIELAFDETERRALEARAKRIGDLLMGKERVE